MEKQTKIKAFMYFNPFVLFGHNDGLIPPPHTHTRTKNMSLIDGFPSLPVLGQLKKKKNTSVLPLFLSLD